MRLLYGCSELGFGHASRTIALGEKLEAEGHEISFFAGGEAHQLLKAKFDHVYSCTPVAWYENTRGISASLSFVNIMFPLPILNGVKTPVAMETIDRYYDLRRHIREIEPDIIISDGDFLALRLGKKWRIPSVYITNMIRPSVGLSPILNPGVRLTERYIRKPLKIIVPDNPPPYTVCERGIGELKSIGVKEKVEFVGSFVDPSPIDGLEEHVFAPISGPLGTRAKLLHMILPALAKLAKRSVVSLGEPGEKKTIQMGNCTVHTWLSSEERAKYMRNASLVVFSGGHITCFETIKYAKPSVCIPTQPEQLANGVKLQSLRCSVVAKDQAQLEAAIAIVQKENAIFRRNVEKLREFSNKFNGVDRAAEVIGTLLQ
jgi:uncharacterized protein (TIGR00661 family)